MEGLVMIGGKIFLNLEETYKIVSNESFLFFLF